MAKHTMEQKKPLIIGSRTVVDFLDAGLTNVPAKIDTGAYSSSIWASDIKETDGELSFRLLDRDSPLFNGKIIRTKDFEVRLVKNSFGHSEFRYRVPLSIKIEGVRLKAGFTLADRSKNRYPILVGRRSLQGRFLVDVTKRTLLKQPLAPPCILVLVNNESARVNTFYADMNRLYGKKVQIDLRTFSELTMRIEDGVMRLRLGLDGRDVSEYDLVYFKTFMRNLELASLTAMYAKQHNVPFVDTAVQVTPANDKLHQYGLLALYGIRVPDSWYLPAKILRQNYSAVKDFLRVPFILKSLNGKKGQYNYLINNKQEFLAACKAAEADNVRLIAQAYLENDGDYRAIVLGAQIAMLIHRQGNKALTHLNNTSAGAKSVHVPVGDLPGDTQKLCIDAAATLQWQIAGVDVMQDKTSGEWYCLEVNNSPQLVSGAFVDKKQEALIAFLLEEAER